VDLQPLDVWDCGFKYFGGYGSPSLVRVVFFHVEVSATGRSLVRKNPSERGVSEFDQGTSQKKPRPTRAVEPREKKTLKDIPLTVKLKLSLCKARNRGRQ